MTLKLAFLGAAIAASSVLVAAEAHASGNEHVVDDAAVETPGVCHLETWTTRFSQRQGLLNLSPACTRKAWPRLEIGGGLQRVWNDGAVETTVGPALKLNILPEERGIGLGLAGTAGYGVRAGRLDTASLIAPMTIPVGQKVRINLNAGWSYVRADTKSHAAFVGAQAEWTLARNLTLMAETFQREGSDAGAQFGMRWNPGGGRIDLDLVAGRRIDGARPRAISLGLTVRR
ncbi:hypothetical protein CFHF_06170 [Caulobacter flavus]|uniref:Uncharacterized protein n=1 Tax=Caulobacter flavus TaxID=1679497 RepID=A0A2N5CX55_9CAUL|nr:hypothetical protein [Caulobacter flavus]AYV47495.1 hypothetical protein C1707_15175 [Caulobacter flavus]PLR18336.1 hypothetical protein CFHF_06170 [Caulobacter flavus]